MFVLDASSSIEDIEYELAKRFLARITKSLDIGPKDMVLVAKMSEKYS